ncbi:MAG: hypothetical protein Q4G49_15090 [Paracoccus sp. (in: a-proteobacteria)]|nr:hypothetical protein [Paracoccus sp. (in: a-proteobacteria)]
MSGKVMAVVVSGLYLIGFHIAMSALCRHFIRRRNFPFFQEHRAARGKPASYGHFLLFYVSWFDPAMMTAAMARPGYRAEQIRCGLLYGAGLVAAVVLALFVAG